MAQLERSPGRNPQYDETQNRVNQDLKDGKDAKGQRPGEKILPWLYIHNLLPDKDRPVLDHLIHTGHQSKKDEDDHGEKEVLRDFRVRVVHVGRGVSPQKHAQDQSQHDGHQKGHDQIARIVKLLDKGSLEEGDENLCSLAERDLPEGWQLADTGRRFGYSFRYDLLGEIEALPVVRVVAPFGDGGPVRFIKKPSQDLCRALSVADRFFVYRQTVSAKLLLLEHIKDHLGIDVAAGRTLDKIIPNRKKILEVSDRLHRIAVVGQLAAHIQQQQFIEQLVKIRSGLVDNDKYDLALFGQVGEKVDDHLRIFR